MIKRREAMVDFSLVVKSMVKRIFDCREIANEYSHKNRTVMRERLRAREFSASRIVLIVTSICNQLAKRGQKMWCRKCHGILERFHTEQKKNKTTLLFHKDYLILANQFRA